MLEEVIAGFLDQIRRQSELLDQAVHQGDAEILAREAHAIKGGAANLTANALAEAAACLEKAARAGELEKIDPLMETLRHEFQRLAVYVEGRGI